MTEIVITKDYSMSGHSPRYDAPPSPFLPGTKIQYAWDSTSLGYIKTCPRLYQYIMLDGWGHSEESVHLRFGQEYHSALQDYDILRVSGLDHEAALREIVLQLLTRTVDFAPDESLKSGKYKNRRTLLRTVIWYLDHFREDAAQTYIMANGKPAVELSFRFELDWGPIAASTGMVPGNRQPYLLCGHLDRVVTFNDSLFVMDHKTTTTTPGDYFFDQFSPNNQMTLYTIASQVVIDSPVKGVIINAMQIMVDTNRPVRGFTYRTPDQLAEWLGDLHYWFELAEGFATANYWPMNDTACDKFGGCRFREVCSKDPRVREQFLKAKFEKLPEDQRWNPLKPR